MTNKKNIVIIGDTWGIIPTGLRKPGSLEQKNQMYDDTSLFDWLDFKLQSLGHSVSNRSWGGSSNFYQLTLAEVYLEAARYHNYNIDVIIWFHGEILKEINWSLDSLENASGHMRTIKEQSLEKGIDDISKDLYEYANNFAKLYPNTKWAIIGAGAPIRKNNLNLLNFADFMVENLRSEILGIDVPECHSYYTLYSQQGFFDILKDKKIFTEEEVKEETRKCEIIENLGKNTDLFFNSKHPSPKAYKNLVEQLIKFIDTI